MYYPLREIRILKGRRSNTYGMVRENCTKIHQGWDFQAKDNSPLYAVSSGEIIYVDRVDNSNYGCAIMLHFQHNGEDLYAFYAHINSSLVSKGQWVTEGDLIGYSGSTGNAKGSKPESQHLHFEFRNKRYCGTGLAGRINPEVYYGTPPYSWFSTSGSVNTEYYYEETMYA